MTYHSQMRRPRTSQCRLQNATNAQQRLTSITSKHETSKALYYSLASSTVLEKTCAADNTRELDNVFLAAAKYGDMDILIRTLDRHSININVRDESSGDTALILAAKGDNAKVVEALVERGADVTVLNEDGKSALDMASNHLKLAVLSKYPSSDCGMGIIKAAWQGDVVSLRSFLSSNNTRHVNGTSVEGLTPLLVVTRDVNVFLRLQRSIKLAYDPLQVIQELLKYKVNVNATDIEGHTALHFATRITAHQLAKDVVNLLLLHRPLLNTLDRTNLAPLHTATNNENVAVVAALVGAGANPNLHGIGGATSLHIGAQQDNEEMIKRLIIAGADVNELDNAGMTPLCVARSTKIRQLMKSLFFEYLSIKGEDIKLKYDELSHKRRIQRMLEPNQDTTNTANQVETINSKMDFKPLQRKLFNNKQRHYDYDISQRVPRSETGDRKESFASSAGAKRRTSTDDKHVVSLLPRIDRRDQMLLLKRHSPIEVPIMQRQQSRLKQINPGVFITQRQIAHRKEDKSRSIPPRPKHSCGYNSNNSAPRQGSAKTRKSDKDASHTSGEEQWLPGAPLIMGCDTNSRSSRPSSGFTISSQSHKGPKIHLKEVLKNILANMETNGYTDEDLLTRYVQQQRPVRVKEMGFVDFLLQDDDPEKMSEASFRSVHCSESSSISGNSHKSIVVQQDTSNFSPLQQIMDGNTITISNITIGDKQLVNLPVLCPNSFGSSGYTNRPKRLSLRRNSIDPPRSRKNSIDQSSRKTSINQLTKRKSSLNQSVRHTSIDQQSKCKGYIDKTSACKSSNDKKSIHENSIAKSPTEFNFTEKSSRRNSFNQLSDNNCLPTTIEESDKDNNVNISNIASPFTPDNPKISSRSSKDSGYSGSVASSMTTLFNSKPQQSIEVDESPPKHITSVIVMQERTHSKTIPKDSYDELKSDSDSDGEFNVSDTGIEDDTELINNNRLDEDSPRDGAMTPVNICEDINNEIISKFPDYDIHNSDGNGNSCTLEATYDDLEWTKENNEPILGVNNIGILKGQRIKTTPKLLHKRNIKTSRDPSFKKKVYNRKLPQIKEEKSLRSAVSRMKNRDKRVSKSAKSVSSSSSSQQSTNKENKTKPTTGTVKRRPKTSGHAIDTIAIKQGKEDVMEEVHDKLLLKQINSVKDLDKLVSTLPLQISTNNDAKNHVIDNKQNLSRTKSDRSIKSDHSSSKSDNKDNRSQYSERRSILTDFTGTTKIESIMGETTNWKKGCLLGAGACGKVWHGVTSEKIEVAVKQIELCGDHEDARDEFYKLQDEVKLLKCLKHENIIRYYGTCLQDNNVNIFMEFVNGGSLSSRIKKEGTLTERLIQDITYQLLGALSYIHAKNIVHRDIKSQNILITEDDRIKLIDFGCSKRLRRSLKNADALRTFRGTPYWMAPEVIKEAGHGTKSDIWSLSCTVYEMLTGNPPWHSYPTMAAMYKIGTGKAVPSYPDNASDYCIDFMKASFIVDPKNRPSSEDLLKHEFIELFSNRITSDKIRSPINKFEYLNHL